MRDKIVKQLNQLLEVDHDLVAAVMASEHIIKTDSPIVSTGAAYKNYGVEVASALSIISCCAGFEQILPVYENGLIQRFE